MYIKSQIIKVAHFVRAHKVKYLTIMEAITRPVPLDPDIMLPVAILPPK